MSLVHAAIEDHDSTEKILDRGIAFAQQGQDILAIRDFREVLARDPDYQTAQEWLDTAQSRQRQREQRQAAYRVFNQYNLPHDLGEMVVNRPGLSGRGMFPELFDMQENYAFLP